MKDGGAWTPGGCRKCSGTPGFSLGAGDVDADGYDDFFAGAPGFEDAIRSDAGRGYLWLGMGF